MVWRKVGLQTFLGGDSELYKGHGVYNKGVAATYPSASQNPLVHSGFCFRPFLLPFTL